MSANLDVPRVPRAGSEWLLGQTTVGQLGRGEQTRAGGNSTAAVTGDRELTRAIRGAGQDDLAAVGVACRLCRDLRVVSECDLRCDHFQNTCCMSVVHLGLGDDGDVTGMIEADFLVR